MTYGMNELCQQIGKVADYNVGDLTFTVEIVDVRTRFGKIDYFITPHMGSGYKWVEASSLQLLNQLCIR